MRDGTPGETPSRDESQLKLVERASGPAASIAIRDAMHRDNTVVELPFARSPETPQRPRWGSILTIRFPGNPERHPRVFDVVEAEIGRPCAIDTWDPGVKVSFSAHGETYAEALDDADTVAARLLGVLGLGTSAVTRQRVLERLDGAGTVRPSLLLSRIWTGRDPSTKWAEPGSLSRTVNASSVRLARKE